jgi:1,2-phenylacetyl-CoA epoxidase catalytic subunit
MMTDQEWYILSYYRACELAGSLLFGKLAFHTAIDEYRIPLTQHCLEEAEHAWLWTRVLGDLGRTPMKITQTYQTEYGKIFGMPENMLEIFCLTQIFERRTLNHFKGHLKLQGTNPLVQRALRKMIDDETGHIGWIRQELEKYARENGREKLDAIMKKLEKMDEVVYKKLSDTAPFKDYFREIL